MGYGVTGQQDIGLGDYPYLAIYTKSKDGAYYYMDVDGDGKYDYITTYRPDAVNIKLKWEQTTTYNAGIDFGFLNNRISGSIDGYYRKTDDLINAKTTVSAGTNFKNTVPSNIGSLENKGVEFTLNVKPIQTKNLTWGDPGIPEMNFNKWSASHSNIQGLYYRFYFDITLCNHFLENTEGKTDDKSVKQRAEARFLRALNYYYLMDMKIPNGIIEIEKNVFVFHLC